MSLRKRIDPNFIKGAAAMLCLLSAGLLLGLLIVREAWDRLGLWMITTALHNLAG